MAKHTPGPWLESENGWIDGPANSIVVEYDGCGSHAACWPNPADKKLALSAPALLDSLQKLLRRYTSLVECGDCGNWDAEAEHEVQLARAAIAAASVQS